VIVRVRLADFDADREEICRIRFTVFVYEQQVPEELEMDDADPQCIHVLAYNDDDPVGTGRVDLRNEGKIGRVAVLAERRGQGAGKAVMAALQAIAMEHQLTEVWCNAQISARPFYEKIGYRVTSTQPFDEAGIPHVRMEKSL
jgi:predicted GNAT family N-acyltransferase